MATRDDVPQVPFPVLAAKAGTMKSTVVVKGERGAATSRGWSADLERHPVLPRR